MKPKSLKGSLQLMVTILVISIGFTVSLLVSQNYSSALLEAATAKAENIAHKLAVDSADLILLNDLVTLQKVLDSQLTATTDVSYIFIEKEGRAIAHTFSEGIPKALLGLNSPESNNSGHLKRVLRAETGERFLDIAWPIFDGHAGILRLGYSEKSYRLQVRQLWTQVSIMTSTIVAIALFVVHFVLIFLTHPLSILTHQVEQIDEENLHYRITVCGRLEVTKLTLAFNRMLNRIKDYTHKLSKSNLELIEKNSALERAHKQLSKSIAISKEIAGLSKLQEICAYLLQTFKSILTCRQMIFVVLDPRIKLHMVTEFESTEHDRSAFDRAGELIGNFESYNYIKPERASAIPLPASIKSAKQLAVFPIREHGEHLGALIVGCRDQCSCNTDELKVIEPILAQSTNAFKRALKMESDLEELNIRSASRHSFGGLIGRDPKMQTVFQLIENVAATDTSVLIQGESGTGKELVARAIHDMSSRKASPFIIINCAAYPATLLESELFGHEKGAFTGADRLKAGRFEQAEGGTVFLDEIGEISQTAQIRLLRVLQSRKFERLGGEKTLTVNIRILAATNKDLAEEVKKGQFREDLFYRLNVIPLQVPPLRERKNDIFLLARHFLKQCTNELKKGVSDYSSEAMHFLMTYHWPGNVRELENTVEYSTVLAKGSRIETTDLPERIVSRSQKNTILDQQTLTENEIKLMHEVLHDCNWNKTSAAKRLGISRSTLYEKMRRYQIEKPVLN